MQSPETASDGLMTEHEQNLGITLGRIDATVTAIKEDSNRRLSNVEASVISLSDEQVKQGQEISTIKSSLTTSYKWMTGLVTIIGIVVGVIMKILLG